MIVPAQTQNSNRALLFMKPFTTAMWCLIGAISIYNGFVVWFIERKHCPELKGSAFNQTGVLLCSSFTTLFSLHGKLVTWNFFFTKILHTTVNFSSLLQLYS
jgi:hypothetical protein